MSERERQLEALDHERVVVDVVQRPAQPISPVLRGIPGKEFAEETKDVAFALYSTFCNGDASAAERMLRREVEPGTPVPTAQTIRNWARDEGWRDLMAAGWRNMARRGPVELKRVMIANVMLAQKIKRDVMTGAYADDVQHGALVLKGAELSDRLLERAVIALAVPEEPEEDVDLDALEREDREARATSEMQRRKRQPGKLR